MYIVFGLFMLRKSYGLNLVWFKLVYVIQVLLTAILDSNTCMTYTYCCVYSVKLLMMDRGTVEFYSKINLRN